MNEKLKYILSDKDSYDPHEALRNPMQKSKNIVIPSRYIAEEKIRTYGGKIADPFLLNVAKTHEVEDRVFTSTEHRNNTDKVIKGVKQIVGTFEAIKRVKPGIEKPDTKGKVTAKRVFNLFPSMQTIPLKTSVLHVMNDDIEAIEEKVPDETQDRQAYYKNNGQFLNKDQAGDKYSLYRHDATHQMKE